MHKPQRALADLCRQEGCTIEAIQGGICISHTVKVAMADFLEGCHSCRCTSTPNLSCTSKHDCCSREDCSPNDVQTAQWTRVATAIVERCGLNVAVKRAAKMSPRGKDLAKVILTRPLTLLMTRKYVRGFGRTVILEGLAGWIVTTKEHITSSDVLI